MTGDWRSICTTANTSVATITAEQLGRIMECLPKEIGPTDLVLSPWLWDRFKAAVGGVAEATLAPLDSLAGLPVWLATTRTEADRLCGDLRAKGRRPKLFTAGLANETAGGPIIREV